MRRPRHYFKPAVLIGMLAVFVLACSSESTTMPDLSGMREEEASAVLRANGIEDWTVEWAEGENPMVVVDQEPDAGQPVEPDTEVVISLSGR